MFTTATTPPVCALVHRLGLRPRVLQPANYSRHVQIITTFLAPFSLRQERIRRGIEDWIECPRRGILGTRPIPAPLICDSLSLSLFLSACVYVCMCVCVCTIQGWSISDAFMRACTARSTATLTGLDRYIGSITMYTVREHGSRFVRFVFRREFCSIISIRRG